MAAQLHVERFISKHEHKPNSLGPTDKENNASTLHKFDEVGLKDPGRIHLNVLLHL